MSQQPAAAEPAAASRGPGACHVIVLAAGRGRRMGGTRPKVLHRLAGRTLIGHVLRAAEALAPASTTVVVGHQADAVMQAIGAGPRCVLQAPQLGTAHALLQAEAVLAGSAGSLVVLSGDVPRIRPHTLRRLVAAHAAAGAAATVLTAELARPYGYGRVVRLDGRFGRIVEETEATPDQRAIREVNSGSTSSTSNRCSRRCAGSRKRGRGASATCRRCCRCTGARDWPWRRSAPLNRRKFEASTVRPSWRK